MPAWGDIVNSLLLNKQELEKGNLQLQAGALALQQQQQNMKLRNEYLAQQVGGALLNPGLPNPGTASVTDSRNEDLTPPQMALRDLQSQLTIAKNNMYAAAKYNQVDEHRIWSTAVDTINTNMREASKEVAQETSKRSTEVANMLAGVNSAAGLQQVVDHIAAQPGGSGFGKGAAFDLDRRLPHDGAGNLIWNDSAKQAIAPYVDRYTTMADRESQRYHSLELQDKAALRDIERGRLSEQVRNDNAHISLLQQGQADARQRHKDVMERMGGIDYKATKDGINQINKLADTYKIRDFRGGFDVADRAEQLLTDPAKGEQAVTPAMARDLSNQFNLMIGNYRRQFGNTKEGERELKSMNGVLQKLEVFTSNIGRGDMILAKEVMLETAREMKTVYRDRNANLAREELQVAATTSGQHGHALVLPYKADYDELLKPDYDGKVKARRIDKNGKSYIAFGPKDSDIYEMPSAPEPLKFIPVETGTGAY